MKTTPLIHFLESFQKNGMLLSLDEMVLLYPVAITRIEMEKQCEELVMQGSLKRSGREYRLTGGEPTTGWLSLQERLRKKEWLLRCVARVPWVSAVCISGSATFTKSHPGGDIDICIITSPQRLFLVRLMVLSLFALFGQRRRRASAHIADTLCLNAMYESDRLYVPYPKRTIFSAREVVHTYAWSDPEGHWAHFIQTNKTWVRQKLPNFVLAQSSDTRTERLPERRGAMAQFFDVCNSIAKYGQLTYMKKHVTNELVTDSQLWLHPNTREKYT